jgi:16S rRNA (uracil1498-N3)-methyltransferase
MSVRIHLPGPLSAGAQLALPPGPSRHLQVLRMQPGEALTVFNGEGGEWAATILRIGRQVVDIEVSSHTAVARELSCAVTLALGMPANDRMDDLVEKATELGVARLQPLVCERSVLRLAGERAERKQQHWQAVAAAASEQSGRTRVPLIEPVRSLGEWLARLPAPDSIGDPAHPATQDAAGRRLVLSLRTPQPLAALGPPGSAVCFLSGPEGGLSPTEEDLAAARGFAPVSLGLRTLRADTAPLAALAWIALASVA